MGFCAFHTGGGVAPPLPPPCRLRMFPIPPLFLKHFV